MTQIVILLNKKLIKLTFDKDLNNHEKGMAELLFLDLSCLLSTGWKTEQLYHKEYLKNHYKLIRQKVLTKENYKEETQNG